MATPTYFTPEKKSDSDRPLPSPARSSKRQVYTDPNFFKTVDEHVTSVAKVGYRTFRDLIWNLVFKENFDELQTARAVFRWVTLKKFHNYTFDGMRANSPDAILQGFKQGITAHSRALECLATHAGLHCVVLSGWAKAGANYKLGAPFTTRLANHSWNAIYINGSWRLMESHWAQRGNSEYDDWFFMPDANQFIYSHFPEDPKWQLSSQVCSKAEFDQYPSTESKFFNVGMKFLQQNQGIIFTHGGVIALTLGLTNQTALIFKLKYGDERSENFQGKPLKRYVIQETLQNRVTYYFRAPRNGDYYLTIYAQDVPGSLELKELYDEAITFMVKCENAASKTEPFPEYVSGKYGPGVELKQYGVTSSESKGLVKVYNGSCKVTLKKTRPVQFLVRLKNDALSPSQLENAVVLEDGENLAVVKCTLPQQGEYGLGIFANEPGKGTDTFSHVCQYLLSYKTQDFQTLYGHVYERVFSNELICYNYHPDVYTALVADGQISPGIVSTNQSSQPSTNQRTQNASSNSSQSQSSSSSSSQSTSSSSSSTQTQRVSSSSSTTQTQRATSSSSQATRTASSTTSSSTSSTTSSSTSSSNSNSSSGRQSNSNTTTSGLATRRGSGPNPQFRNLVESMEARLTISSPNTPASQRRPPAPARPTSPPRRTPSAPPVAAPTSQPAPAPDSTTSNSSSDPASPRIRLSCPVCLEDDKQIREANRKLVSTLCGHIFCETCITGCIQSQHRCPMCKTNLSTGDFHPIYF